MELAQFPQEMHLLPGRFGPRPRTTAGLPFRQVDQLPAAGMNDRILALCQDLPDVRLRQSRVAAPGTTALWIPDALASGPDQAFIDGNEFCHLHAAPHGSIHLTLPPTAVEGIVALGWVERHPIHTIGIMKSLVMVYAPRNREEVEVVMNLIDHSCRFAMGLAGSECAAAPFRML
jgi:hypothetical protein